MHIFEDGIGRSKIVYWLNNFLFFPSMELRALLYITSGLNLLDIEKYFMFGEGRVNDHLLDSFSNYWHLALDELKAVNDKICSFLSGNEPGLKPNAIQAWYYAKFFKEINECGNNTGDIYLDHGMIEPSDSYSISCSSRYSDFYKDRKMMDYCFLTKELMERDFHFCLKAPIHNRLEFLHQFMSEEYIYGTTEELTDGFVFPLDTDPNDYIKKHLFPITKACKPEAKKFFESLVKSLEYKKSSTKSLIFTVTDLENEPDMKKRYENLQNMRKYCQELRQCYSEEKLYKELIEKGCKPITAVRLLYKFTHKTKARKPLKNKQKPCDINFGFNESTLNNRASRLNKKIQKMADIDETDFIKRLLPKNLV